MTTTITKQKNGQIEESAKTIIARLKKNCAEMNQLIERVGHNLAVAIGRDLNQLKKRIPRGLWLSTLKEIGISEDRGVRYMLIANNPIPRARNLTINEHLRRLGSTSAMPRQKADEQPIRNILAGIDSKVLLEREVSDKKEDRLKKMVALELVAAGYRALSHKVHSDKGGSDDAMRRLTNVQTTLKVWIEDDLIVF